MANNGVFVVQGTDDAVGNVTWNAPTAVASHLYDGRKEVLFEIIPDLAVDTSRRLPDGRPNPNFGNLYAVWTRLYPAGLPFPNADIMLAYMNEKDGKRFATVPVAVFFDRDLNELYRYVEYPAIYHKARLFGHLRKTGGDIGAVFTSPFFDVWAQAAIDEIVSALHERLVVGAS